MCDIFCCGDLLLLACSVAGPSCLNALSGLALLCKHGCFFHWSFEDHLLLGLFIGRCSCFNALSGLILLCKQSCRSVPFQMHACVLSWRFTCPYTVYGMAWPLLFVLVWHYLQ